MNIEIEAIILAGGKGSRLTPVVPLLPKPLAPIGAVPFLDYLLAQLALCPYISKWIFSLGYKVDHFESYFAARKFPKSYVVSIENSPLGTGGALRKALDFATTSDLLVLNGDSFLELSWPLFLEQYRLLDADVMIAGTLVEECSRFGEMVWDVETHRILSFHEKRNQQKRGWINAGIYLLKRSFIENLSREASSFEQYLMEHVTGKRLFVYPTTSFFSDIGTPASYADAQKVFLKRCPLPQFSLQEVPVI